MTEIKDIIMKILRKGYRLIFKPKFDKLDCIINRHESNDMITNLLRNDAPCLIARLGTTEIGIVNNYICIHKNESIIKKLFDFITKDTELPWWMKDKFKICQIGSGIFPAKPQLLDRFSEQYLKDIPKIDLLGTFNNREIYMPLKQGCQYVHLESLYPFFTDNPWTRALEGKKILIVHPFKSSILHQYSIYNKLFKDTRIFPKYDLTVLKAIVSYPGENLSFGDWFDALKYMENEISKIDFDICILGCGAYGLPLGAFVKDMGKKAIHLGGGSQLLFGIKGKRWNENYRSLNLPNNANIDINYSKLYNKYWISPLSEDIPKSAQKVEGGCYW